MAVYRRVVPVTEYIGSTAFFYRMDDGLLLKSSHDATISKGLDHLMIEKIILERLNEHPRIIPYKGFYDHEGNRGLLLLEASHGDLQSYINANNQLITLPTRRKWCRQVTEAVQHLHRNDVIHSDLRPENFLLHETNASLDLLLCDFGGSMCPALGLDGRSLPDSPFWNLSWETTVDTDIFSLGSIFYTIMTGHWPYQSRTLDGDEQEDKWAYADRVERLVKAGKYPELNSISCGTIIWGCWNRSFVTVEEILQAQDAEARSLEA